MIKTLEQFIDVKMSQSQRTRPNVRLVKEAFVDGWIAGCALANDARGITALIRLKDEVTRLNDRVRALKHENNKLRKELWQRKESK